MTPRRISRGASEAQSDEVAAPRARRRHPIGSDLVVAKININGGATEGREAQISAAVGAALFHTAGCALLNEGDEAKAKTILTYFGSLSI